MTVCTQAVHLTTPNQKRLGKYGNANKNYNEAYILNPRYFMFFLFSLISFVNEMRSMQHIRRHYLFKKQQQSVIHQRAQAVRAFVRKCMQKSFKYHIDSNMGQGFFHCEHIWKGWVVLYSGCSFSNTNTVKSTTIWTCCSKHIIVTVPGGLREAKRWQASCVKQRKIMTGEASEKKVLILTVSGLW